MNDEALDQLRAEAQRIDAEINRLQRRQNLRIVILAILTLAAGATAMYYF
jgi:hypothetical protein